MSAARSSTPAVVALITPADILGDLPKGAGQGRGNYAPPPPEPAAGESAGPNSAALAADEQLAPKPKAVSETIRDPNEIAIPKKRIVKESKPKPTATVKKSSAKPPAAAKSSLKAGSANTAASAEAIRRRFASALAAAEDGTPGGDNQSPGGGTGESKYGRLGSPNGAPDGIAGGVGKGSPFWSYYLRVHDVMYEAWEQPGQALNFDNKLVATILLRVARDGRILDVRLQNSSGNKLMDDSALAAARDVPRLDPLPEGLGGETADITVNFRLEG
ncbi:MAG TPA: cell envelope integrity protein TolA [Verrucomicrobiae bacterium]|nr:cell envelope integrity protein TolA [Verrucomicrobiae bacterium]